MITKSQRDSLIKTYVQWMSNEEMGFDLDNINHWLRDFTEFTNFFVKIVDLYNDLMVEKTEDKFDDFVQYVYNAVNTNKSITSNQTCEEVKENGWWDMNFKSITITVQARRKNFDFRISDYFNGYAKINGSELFEPFEDIEYTTLKYFAEEEMQKTTTQMLAKIQEIIEKPLYDELSAYEQGIRDMINFLNNREYATNQDVYFHIYDTYLQNHSKEYGVL